MFSIFKLKKILNEIETEKKITHTVELFGLIESIRIYLKIIKTTNNQEKKITKQNLKKKVFPFENLLLFLWINRRRSNSK